MANKYKVNQTERSTETEQLHRRIEELEQRCAEAEEALDAIQRGEVDALVIYGEPGEQVYTLQGADTTYRLLIESMNEGAATLIEDGTILYCNRRFAEMLDIPLEAVIGSTIYQYIHPDNESEFSALLNEGIRGHCLRGNCRGEVSMTRKDGQSIPVMMAVSNFNTAGSSGVSIVTTDLTDRKMAEEMRVLLELKTQAEEELRIAHDDLTIINENLIAEVVEHEKTEAQLKVTQQVLQTIIDRMPAAIALIRGTDLCVQLVNPAYQAIAPRKSMVGYTLDEIFPEAEMNFTAVCQSVLDTGESYRAVDEAIKIQRTPGKPAERAYFTWSLHRVWLPGEQDWGLVEVIWETTDRKKAEIDLNESRKKFQDLIETTSEFIWETDSQGRYTYCSPQMETLWGMKPETMIGKTPFDNMPPEVAQQGIENFKDLASAGKPFKGLTTVSYDSKGQLIYVEISGTPFFDGEGRLLGYRGITHDITERQQAEEKLQQAYDEMEQRVRERTSELLFLNQELKAEVGERKKAEQKSHSNAKFAEGLAQSIITMNSSLDLEHVLDAILEQLRQSVPYSTAAITQIENGTIHLVRYKSFRQDTGGFTTITADNAIKKNPQIKKVSLRNNPLNIVDTSQDPKWVPIPGTEWIRSYLAVPLVVGERFRGTIHLASEQPSAFTPEMVNRVSAFSAPAALAIQNALFYKNLENALQNEQNMRLQLIQAEKLSALSRMLATVVHEINNPVQTVKNCIYLAKLDVPEGSNAMESLQMATTEVERIGNLVSGLRNIYRKPKNIEMEPLDVTTLIADVHILLDPHLTHNKITWEQQAPDGPLWTCGVADHLKQVFLNITMNAIEAMEPDGGTITVDLKGNPKKKEVSVSITDTGCGIDLADLPKLFEPFYTTKEGGSGLGLPICYGIVQHHSGRILVDSSVGNGSTFTVTLPAIPPPED